MNNRYCSIDNKTLPFNMEGYQEGFYCCGEYFCSQECLDNSFENTGETWNQHYYSEYFDCYWTVWHDDMDGVLYVAA